MHEQGLTNRIIMIALLAGEEEVLFFSCVTVL